MELYQTSLVHVQSKIGMSIGVLSMLMGLIQAPTVQLLIIMVDAS